LKTKATRRFVSASTDAAMASLEAHAFTNPRQNESTPESSTNTATLGLPMAALGATDSDSIASSATSSAVDETAFEVPVDGAPDCRLRYKAENTDRCCNGLFPAAVVDSRFAFLASAAKVAVATVARKRGSTPSHARQAAMAGTHVTTTFGRGGRGAGAASAPATGAPQQVFRLV